MARFTLVIDSPPEAVNAHANALGFANAALTSGHEINCVFFFQQAVNIANHAADWPADEQAPADAWLALANSHSLELVLCSAAAQRRGLDEAMHTVKAGFRIGGLGELVTATRQSDRVMQF